MRVVEKVGRARKRVGFLHDYHTHIAQLHVHIGIDVKGIDTRRGQDRARRERKDLVIVAESFHVGEKQTVGELGIDIRLERVFGTRGGGARCAREQSS